ncbi:MAG TPA: hypothetical protein VK154_16305 [Chitinophagales bacterium]|nr:hypothetical protein [Chitinophagales bacterium]
MKQIRFIITTLAILFATVAFAQYNMEDVIYLKNGSVYRGMIIEQVPNVSYKIQIRGGSIFSVTVAEVEKITKEQRYQNPQQAEGHGDMFMHPHFGYAKGDSARHTPSYLRKRRFFKELEFRPGINQISLRLVHGFKFGRFGYVGLGIGADAVSFSNRISDGKNIFNNSTPNNGLYIPIYIKYSGEILKKRVTPYYFIEAGYAAHPNNPFVGSNGNKSWGGPTAAAGFGCRFYSKGRASFAINANANWRSNRYRTTYSSTDVFGNPYTYTQRGMTSKVFGAIGLSVGF